MWLFALSHANSTKTKIASRRPGDTRRTAAGPVSSLIAPGTSSSTARRTAARTAWRCRRTRTTKTATSSTTTPRGGPTSPPRRAQPLFLLSRSNPPLRGGGVKYFPLPRRGHLVTEPTSAASNRTQETNLEKGKFPFFPQICGRGARSHGAARQGASWALGFPTQGSPECVLGLARARSRQRPAKRKLGCWAGPLRTLVVL